MSIAIALPAAAQQTGRVPAAEQRRSLEASMLVAGSIDIQPDGSVSAYRLQHAERLPPEAARIVRQTVTGWRFEPVLVDGVARPVTSPMRLRLIARPVGDDYVVSVTDASFFDDDDITSTEQLRIDRQRPAPRYPPRMVAEGIPATAYVALRIGRDGKVSDAMVQQVNLHRVIYSRLDDARNEFARAALTALKRWTFHVPTTGPESDAESWTGVIPVTFCIEGALICDRDSHYGRWVPHVPGPSTQPAWLDDDQARRLSNTAIADNGLSSGHERLQLLTSLDGD
ncbi:MAG: hypothetical protein Q4F49_01360 [Pseudoxanthomonas suwonensis]|nr:hypothetical protein [Pseudoxanthomonas suwonensis]